jgi:hypothetical protein
MNSQKDDLANRMAVLNPNYKNEDSQSAKYVWKAYKTAFFVLFLSALVYFPYTILNPLAVVIMWPILFAVGAGFYVLAITSLFGVFIFKIKSRRILAAVALFACLAILIIPVL